MIHSSELEKGNLVKLALLRQAAALREQAVSLETLAAFTEITANDSDEWLDKSQLAERYGLGKASADACGIPRARIGRKNKWKVSDIEAAIVANPVKPRRKPRMTGVNVDPIDQMIASGELRKVGTR